MAWTNLPTNYTDAVWSGNRKYRQINNSDGTVSFEDVTEYTQKENSFFGAAEANQMNAAMNELAGNIDSVEENAKSAATSAVTAGEKATSAANSASAAKSSKSAAATSATNAANSATTATQKATAAGNSQTAAANSATAAANSASAAQASAAKVTIILFDNAGAHNAIYRGKNLGTSVTNAQWAAISAGTFEDLYIGDYWVINGVNWRIAAFDYYLDTGDARCTTHHVVIVPDTSLDYQPMNSDDTTAGGYTGSAMYRVNMATAENKIKSAFGSAHLLTHSEYLVNAVANGRPSGGAWFNSTVELMTEQNVYGGKVFAPTSDGSSVPTVHTVDKSQYPLFAHNPHMISNGGQTYWLRDVVSASYFALVFDSGLAGAAGAHSAIGVRPAFSIKS